MTEQEATELIATKLMDRVVVRDPHRPELIFTRKDSSSLLMHEHSSAYEMEPFNPFHDSNHARMVKDHIGYTAPHIYAPRLAKRLNLPPKVEDWTWVDAFSYHNAPDADCMWAVVDILKEIEK